MKIKKVIAVMVLSSIVFSGFGASQVKAAIVCGSWQQTSTSPMRCISEFCQESGQQPKFTRAVQPATYTRGCVDGIRPYQESMQINIDYGCGCSL